MIGKSSTHYDTLKVSRDAPLAVVKAAYRVLAQQYHPDRNTSPDSEQKMRSINEAWHVLSDEARRAEYDLSIDDLQPHSGFSGSKSHPRADESPDVKQPAQNGSTTTMNARGAEAEDLRPRRKGYESPPPPKRRKGYTRDEDEDKPRTLLRLFRSATGTILRVIAVLWMINSVAGIILVATGPGLGSSFLGSVFTLILATVLFKLGSWIKG